MARLSLQRSCTTSLSESTIQRCTTSLLDTLDAVLDKGHTVGTQVLPTVLLVLRQSKLDLVQIVRKAEVVVLGSRTVVTKPRPAKLVTDRAYMYVTDRGGGGGRRRDGCGFGVD